MTPDVNVLVAASRDDHPHHAVAREWLETAVDEASAGGGLILLPMVVASFLRLATNTKVFVSPTPTEDAVAFIDALLAMPGVRMPEVGGEWPRLRALCLSKKLRANSLPDAWIAAATQQLGEHLVTFDADFRKLLKRAEFTLLAV
ncbi:MAG: TA system VapC family ribonuclease toxin [Pseudomonadota bacterium]